jgi:hypothetical protein
MLLLWTGVLSSVFISSKDAILGSGPSTDLMVLLYRLHGSAHSPVAIFNSDCPLSLKVN